MEKEDENEKDEKEEKEKEEEDGDWKTERLPSMYLLRMRMS